MLIKNHICKFNQ